jgi:hypothetical protein
MHQMPLPQMPSLPAPYKLVHRVVGKLARHQMDLDPLVLLSGALTKSSTISDLLMVPLRLGTGRYQK